MKKTILLTGGLGFVGSVTAHVLHALGYQVVILDKFVHHQACAVPWAQVIKGDICNRALLASIFAQYNFAAVMHFAGLIEVGASVTSPDAFYTNNVVGTLGLLDVMHNHQVPHIIFSSSCSVYGTPTYVPIDENHQCAPASPYGRTKHAIEYAIKDYAAAFGMNFVILRYFNAAGAALEYGLGECHNPETHVIPLLLRAGRLCLPFSVYGADYDTSDGTCVRDYVHVHDIARAHVFALDYLMHGKKSEICNLGTGNGYSIYELIEAAQRVSGCSIVTKIVARREGDVATLVANAAKAQSVLNWRPQRSDIKSIMHDAWLWEQQRAITSKKSSLPVCNQ